VLRSFARSLYNADDAWSVPKQRQAKTDSIWAAGFASEQGKGVITTQEEPDVRERIRAGPGFFNQPRPSHSIHPTI
jgi:hypothetical protein